MTDDEIRARLDRLEAEEELWREHSPTPTIVGSLRNAWSGVAYSFGDRDALVAREYVAALAAAEDGKLAPQHIVRVSRFAAKHPPAKSWVRILQRLLLEQGPTKAAPRPAAPPYKPRPMPWAGGYVGDTRRPGESAKAFVLRSWDPFVGVDDEEAAKFLEVPVEVVREVRAEWSSK